MNSWSRSAAWSFTKKVKPPSEDKWHMRSGVYFLFFKKKKEKKKKKPKHFMFTYFPLKIMVSVINSF